MSDLSIRTYTASDAERWDDFCTKASNATFLHTRRFLSYHGERFHDVSCIVESTKEWLGILPAAVHPEHPECVVSHPGLTYGGLLHSGRLMGEDMLNALHTISKYYRQLGYQRLLYKPVPHIYQRSPAQDDLYALFRLDARRYRCDLSSTIDLRNRRSPTSRRIRSRRKASGAGVEICTDIGQLEAFWTILEANLLQRYQTRPAHTLAEIRELAQRFPEHITLTCANLANQVVAGTLLFHSPMVVHAQYIATSELGQKTCALDAVFENCISTTSSHARYFDFGISNEHEGQFLNTPLYNYKTEFGGGGVAYESYEINI